MLLHDVKIGHIVAREAVDQAVETGNVYVLKAVLKRLITIDTQCRLNIVTVDTLQRLVESTDEPEIKYIIQKQLAKILVNRAGVNRVLCSSKMLGRNVFKLVTKKIAPVTGFILITSLHLFLLSKVIQLEENYSKLESSYIDYIKGVATCLTGKFSLILALAFLFNATCCLLCSLVCSAGT